VGLRHGRGVGLEDADHQVSWHIGKQWGEREPKPIGSMYGIYSNIWGILMGSMLPYIAYMDPMGNEIEATQPLGFLSP